MTTKVTRKVTRFEMPNARNSNWGAKIRTWNIPINSRSTRRDCLGEFGRELGENGRISPKSYPESYPLFYARFSVGVSACVCPAPFGGVLGASVASNILAAVPEGAR
jgi:hypothetical protein